MKKVILIAALAVAGCTNTPKIQTPAQVLAGPRPAAITTPAAIVINETTIGKAEAPKVPKLPASLAKKAGPLPRLTDPSVAGMQNDGAATDRAYNSVAVQLNNVIDAWSCVVDALNNEKDAKACFKG